MQTPGNDITDYVLMTEIAGAAAMDTYADFSVMERAYMHWAVRALEKLTNETFKTGVRRAIIPVNKNFNSALIDCDFKEAIFVGEIDKYTGEKRSFHRVSNLVNTEYVETIPDDIICPAKCEGCFSKALCNDLQTTSVSRTINLYGTDYFETTDTVLQPDGSYFVTTTTPFYNTVTSEVEYRTKKNLQATLELAPCGCVVNTPSNTEQIKTCNFDCYATYCTPYCRDHVEVGYAIFKDTGTIKFDHRFHGDSFYFEWRGSVPKRNGEYIAPSVAKETLINLTKYLSIANRKDTPQWKKREWFDDYTRERSNMDIVRMQTSVHQMLYNLTATPNLDYHY